MTTIPDGSLTGHLLVAAPALADPNFSHAVLLLLDHDEEGAFGVTINRPSDTAVAEAVPPWVRTIADPGVVFVGGPVQQSAMVALGRLRSDDVDTLLVAPGIGIVDLAGDPRAAEVDFTAVRVFAGYAGWGGGQLEAELAEGAWFVVEPDPADPFSAAPDQLWRVVLARQGGIFVTVPEDPGLN